MKQVIFQEVAETVPVSKVSFNNAKPIGLESTLGEKYLLIRVYGKKRDDMWEYAFLNMGIQTTVLKDDYFLDDLLNSKIEEGYQVFLFESRQEFYQWCAE